MVDDMTYHLTGVIDWAETKDLFFRLGLCFPENTYGEAKSQGWRRWYEDSDTIQ